MRMPEPPERRTMPAGLVRSLLLLLSGLLLTAALWPVLWDLLQGPRDLYALSADELEGTYAAAQLDTIYDWYADSVAATADGSQVPAAREYLVPLGDGRTFIGVEVPADLIPTGDHVLEQTMLWLQDPDAYFWDGSYLEVRGEIRPMDEDTRAMYYDLLRNYYGVTEEDLVHFPPLVLVHGELHGLKGGTITVLGLAALFFLALGGAGIVRALTAHRRRVTFPGEEYRRETDLQTTER